MYFQNVVYILFKSRYDKHKQANEAEFFFHAVYILV